MIIFMITVKEGWLADGYCLGVFMLIDDDEKMVEEIIENLRVCGFVVKKISGTEIYIYIFG